MDARCTWISMIFFKFRIFFVFFGRLVFWFDFFYWFPSDSDWFGGSTCLVNGLVLITLPHTKAEGGKISKAHGR